MNVRMVSERSAMQCNEGRLNEVGLQDTGAAVRNDAAKAKGMTAWSAAKPLGEKLVLFVRMDVCKQQH